MRLHRSSIHWKPSIILLSFIILMVCNVVSVRESHYLANSLSFHSSLEPQSDPVRMQNETSDGDEDSILPMIVSGIIILILVIVVSYFTLKEQERQKMERKKARREERRLEREKRKMVLSTMTVDEKQ